jgi:ribulose-5-phosphate 4-epimerase/fuculose-1-phosphate aldolase
LVQAGLNRGTSGNCSVRLADGTGFRVTPSGVSVPELNEERMVRMDSTPTRKEYLHAL